MPGTRERRLRSVLPASDLREIDDLISRYPDDVEARIQAWDERHGGPLSPLTHLEWPNAAGTLQSYPLKSPLQLSDARRELLSIYRADPQSIYATS